MTQVHVKHNCYLTSELIINAQADRACAAHVNDTCSLGKDLLHAVTEETTGHVREV
jgi:acyl-[acyl carrier protein]--UDP-N-acetylglucosamine O-acyltransferase